jgi:hypothetical protein
VLYPFETSVHVRTTLLSVPEDGNVHNYRCENLKSCEHLLCVQFDKGLFYKAWINIFNLPLVWVGPSRRQSQRILLIWKKVTKYHTAHPVVRLLRFVSRVIRNSDFLNAQLRHSFMFLLCTWPDIWHFPAYSGQAQVILRLMVSRPFHLCVGPPLGQMSRLQISLSDNYCLTLHVGRPLWREDGPVICSAIPDWLQ